MCANNVANSFLHDLIIVLLLDSLQNAGNYAEA
jgi:hypothetical protein